MFDWALCLVPDHTLEISDQVKINKKVISDTEIHDIEIVYFTYCLNSRDTNAARGEYDTLRKKLIEGLLVELEKDDEQGETDDVKQLYFQALEKVNEAKDWIYSLYVT